MPPTDPTLAALEAELRHPVRALAPAPRAAWAASLDRRVAAGFPRARRTRSRTVWWAPVAALAACAILALLVVGLGSEPSTRPSAPAVGSSEGVQAERDQATPSAGSPSAVEPFAGRQVERSTDLSVAVAPRRLEPAAQRVYAITGAAGGIVDSSSVSSGGGGGTATFALRIPTSRLDRTVARLAALGRVRSQTSSTDDITGAFTSVGERLRGALAERRGILRALERATTQTQIDALRERRRLVEGEIAGLRRERAGLRRRTAYGRVSLELATRSGGGVPAHEGDGRWTPGDALGDAGAVLSVAAGVLILALAIGLPLALLFGLAWAAARPVRRRRRESSLGPV